MSYINIRYYIDYHYINEIVLEQKANEEDGVGVIFIPPFVMLHMLFFLNHYKLGDSVRSQKSLKDLYTLMLSTDGISVPKIYQDISWQILGICQQTFGDFEEALHSFNCSLQNGSLNYIKTATMIRIRTIC